MLRCRISIIFLFFLIFGCSNELQKEDFHSGLQKNLGMQALTAEDLPRVSDFTSPGEACTVDKHLNTSSANQCSGWVYQYRNQCSMKRAECGVQPCKLAYTCVDHTRDGSATVEFKRTLGTGKGSDWNATSSQAMALDAAWKQASAKGAQFQDDCSKEARARIPANIRCHT